MDAFNVVKDESNAMRVDLLAGTAYVLKPQMDVPTARTQRRQLVLPPPLSHRLEYHRILARLCLCPIENWS